MKKVITLFTRRGEIQNVWKYVATNMSCVQTESTFFSIRSVVAVMTLRRLCDCANHSQFIERFQNQYTQGFLRWLEIPTFSITLSQGVLTHQGSVSQLRTVNFPQSVKEKHAVGTSIVMI